MKTLQLGEAIQADLENRANEQAMNQDSLSHEYDVAESRNKAFQ